MMPCSRCQVGTFSDRGSSTCPKCASGSFNPENGSAACWACRVGTYSILGMSMCTLCSEGHYSNFRGQSSCQKCRNNSFSKVGSAAAGCTCNLGYTGLDGTTQDCVVCLAGTYKDVNGSAACSKCSEGKYQPANGSRACINCPAFSGSIAASFNVSDCTCEPGYTGPAGGNCSACASGFFKAAYGSGACRRCLSNAFSNVSASTCSICPTLVNITGNTTLLDGCPLQQPNTTLVDSTAADRAAAIKLGKDTAQLVSTVVAGAVGEAVAGAMAGGAGAGAATLIEQVQFLSIIGTVGGAQNADPGRAPFHSFFPRMHCHSSLSLSLFLSLQTNVVSLFA